MMIACAHASTKRFGYDRKHRPRVRCLLCGKTWTIREPKPLGDMRVSAENAKLALRLLVEGNSVRSTARITGLDKATVLKLIVRFGDACRTFLDERMRGLRLSHLQFDEQWTYIARKQARLTVNEKAERHDVGDVYLWT